MKKIIITFIILLITGVILFEKYDQWFVFPGLRVKVSNAMKDPNSTMFSNEKMTASGWMCGEVNAKNGYGAYAGYKRFFAAPLGDAYVEDIGHIPNKEKLSTNDLLEHSKNLLEDVNSRIAIKANLMAKRKQSEPTKQLSNDELDDLTMQTWFNERWKSLCKN